MDNGFGMLCEFQQEPSFELNFDQLSTSEQPELTFKKTGVYTDIFGPYYKQEEYKEWRKAARASFTSGVSALKNHLEKIYKNKITHDENVLP